MSRAARLWPLVAGLVTSAALYVSRGVLDAVWLNGRAVRVALLPPWESLLGFVLLAFTAGVLLHHLARTRAERGLPPPLAHLTRPALALVVCLLPFLPWLPDRWPVLQTIAGPMGGLVWLVVTALLMWTWWQHRLLTAAWFQACTATQGAMLIGVATAVLSGAAASRLTGTVLFPAGDEPHYLVIAQSLWRDGDFKIENNHQRGDYREYFNRELEPHYLTRGADGDIYSIHPVGLPLVIAPVYAIGGYVAVLVALIVMASLAAGLAWRWVATSLDAPGAATFGWAVVAASAPFLLNTFTVYPEIGAALAVMIGITTRHPIVLGVACGVLPWLSTKYAPMSAALLATGLVSGSGPSTWRVAPLRTLVRAALPYAGLLLAWFAFFYAIWGTPMPQAPYGAMVQTTPWNLIFGAPGLLFDQEYGLLPYAPAYILAVTGLWALWRRGGEPRALAIRVVLVFGALLGTVGAFRIWWGGSAAPARPIASGLLLLCLPIAAAFAAAPAASARRAAQHLLLWVGVGIAVTLVLAQEGLLIAQGRDGTSSLLEWWSPRWELWTLAPSFIHHEAATALAHSAAWLLVAAIAAVVLGRRRPATPGDAALAAFSVFGLALGGAALLVPVLPSDPPMPRVSLQARSRLPALDRFDVQALPAAVVFDPLRKTSAADLLPAMSLAVAPGLRQDPQPVRVIHNGRFSLPAGTYRLDVAFASGRPLPEADLSLQVGRVGPPLRTWHLEASTTSLSQTFRLPVDANFVGLRGSRVVEEAVQSVTVTPLAIVNAGQRLHRPSVLGSALYGGTLVLLHDDQVSTEPTGFWVLGQRETVLSVSPSDVANAPAVLQLRSGVANTVMLQAPGWSRTVTLAPNEPQEVELPPSPRGLVPLTIVTTTGFRPVDLDPGSRDRRFLGVWVEPR